MVSLLCIINIFWWGIGKFIIEGFVNVFKELDIFLWEIIIDEILVNILVGWLGKKIL